MRHINHNIHFSSGTDGFTIIELVAVLVIISVTCVIIIGQIGDSKADLDARTDTLKAHLRYAQSRAMDSDLIWGVKKAGTGYSLFTFDGSSETILRLPGEESTIVDLSETGISLGTFGSVSFDSWGSPFSNSTGTGGSTETVITVSSGSMPPNPIVITKNTGFVQ